MKNKKLFIFVFIIFTLFIVKIDSVFADNFYVTYTGCQKMIVGDSIVDGTNMSQSVKIGVGTKSYVCCDKDFKGWKVTGTHSCTWLSKGDCRSYVYCNDGSKKPKYELSDSFTCPSGQSVFIYSNGATLNETGSPGDNVLMTAVKDSNANNTVCDTVDDDNDGIVDDIDDENNGISNDKCVDYSFNDCPRNCATNSKYKFCSPNGLTYLQCGDSYDIPEMVPELFSFAVSVLKTITPIVLIVISIIQLIKAITAGKEDEIKKAQTSLIKKVIIAAIIFSVVSLVQFVLLRVAANDQEKKNLSSCLSCLLNGTNKCGNMYYKDGYGYCYNVNDNSKTAFKCGIE